MIIKYDKKRIEIPVKEAGFFRKGFGLMFRGRETESLLFEFHNKFERNITSLFVFFSFLGIWIDGKNRVLKAEVIKPWRFSIKGPERAEKLVEVPINMKNQRILRFFVGKMERFKYPLD